MTENQYANTDLWIKINLNRMYIKEIEIAKLLYDELGKTEGILGVQKIQANSRSIAIVYCADEAMKQEVLAVSQITYQGETLRLASYTPELLRPSERVSIHGIPLHVSNRDVEDWISERVDITSPIQYAFKEENQIRINSGNRFVYGRVKQDVVFPRYNSMLIEDPGTPSKLIEIDTTIYINSQPINCYRCKEISHLGRDCPTRKTVTCRQCFQPGHFAKFCPQNNTKDDDSNDNDSDSEIDSVKSVIRNEKPVESVSSTESTPATPQATPVVDVAASGDTQPTNTTSVDSLEVQPANVITNSAPTKPESKTDEAASGDPLATNTTRVDSLDEVSGSASAKPDSKTFPIFDKKVKSKKRPPNFTPPSTEKNSKKSSKSKIRI
ncbi:unnamed protein product [Owenia fusiformis]|uniref:CCHC-type domain-containing protein n=1 Tax=Owenia fusiformis TaxID=6347 RepID=A0A8S4NEE1_OWEFU|nr:unnamed protein product [Owenia fusiformis]